MKKVTILIIAILTWGVLPAFSQSSNFLTNRFYIGIIGGINFADMHFPNNSPGGQEISTLLGFGAGAILDIRFTENFFLRMEPMYLQKGCTIKEGTNPLDQPGGQINSSSIELPILLQYAFGNSIKPYFVAGPTLAYNLEQEIEFDLSGLNFKGDLKDVTESFDFGLTFGGGVLVPAGFGIIFLEGRYVFGLINQRKTGTATVSSNGLEFELDADKERDKSTNRGFQLLAGISIPLDSN